MCRVRSVYHSSDVNKVFADRLAACATQAAFAGLADADNEIIVLATQNMALAMLRLNRPVAALYFALSALRLCPEEDGFPPRFKAIFRAGMACAKLNMPQAAAFFLSTVCYVVCGVVLPSFCAWLMGILSPNCALLCQRCGCVQRRMGFLHGSRRCSERAWRVATDHATGSRVVLVNRVFCCPFCF